ncbi:MAG TPA: hypothetical protein VEY71_02070 [Chitinophagales bacterium]|nr:hypothetical protein [Chitinophagales bacterium]
MSTETSTKPRSTIVRLIIAVVLVAIGYYGFNKAGPNAQEWDSVLKVISAIICFIGLYLLFKAITELINHRKALKR